MMRRVLTTAAAVIALVGLSSVVPAPAQAAGRVSVANEDGGAKVDPTYATTLKVRGNGFQSVQGGHGGVYVFFGTVNRGWKPSAGGATGQDYFYVPDSEAANNAGFQRYVAFPGSDTASSANGGVMSGNGSWSTEIVVPGAVFEAFDRSGGSRTIDCRKVTCGVITVGAHGVVNNNNETFTPVTVGDLYAGEAPSAAPSASPSAAPTAPTTAAPTAPAAPGAPTASSAPAAPAGPASLEIDRASATAGNVLAFTARNLPAGSQVSAVLDDGAAAAGPFVIGADGQLAGVITIPADLPAGTHELRLFGVDNPPTVRFAVAAGESDVVTPVAEESDSATQPLAIAFVVAAAALLIAAIAVRVALRRKRARRAA